ncbi:hypothetical protein [Filifactor villosus]|uniref:Uncharacterized protein n=1 Tax=Filifactor villosus TaxID=29374 RepID=A0ABV9QS46_9FIRM
MYEMYLGKLKIPLLPSSLKESASKDNKKYDVLSLGEVVKPGRMKLRTWTITSELRYTDGVDAKSTIEAIKKYLYDEKTTMKPLRFIVNRFNEDGSISLNTNALVVIDSFEITDKEAEPGDFHYSIKLTEYRKFEAKIL